MSLGSIYRGLAASSCLATLASFSVCSSVAAQTVIGRVLDQQSRAPVRAAAVRLVSDTGDATAALATTTTDTTGAFYLDVPRPGTYRLAFTVGSVRLLSNPIVVKDDNAQREFLIDTQPDRPYFEFQVEQQIAARPDQEAPRYPDALRNAGIQGEVLVQFVVDTLGSAEMSTFKVLRSTHPDFTYAVRSAVASMRFYPAEIGHRKVRQLAQMPFHFCLNGGARPRPVPDTSRYRWIEPVRPGVCP